MFSTQKVLTTLAGVTTVSVLSLASSSVHASTLTGGFGFSGTANLNPAEGTNPASVEGTFTNTVLFSTSGSFADLNPGVGAPSLNQYPFVPNPITFTRSGFPPFYNSQPFDINFGQQTLNGETGTLTVTVSSEVFLRSSSPGSSSLVNFNQVVATALFNDTETLLSGAFSISDTSSGDGTFQLSFGVPSIPEPSANYALLLLGVLGCSSIARKLISFH